MKINTQILGIMFALTGCTHASESNILVLGNLHKYAIPAEFLKSENSTYYASELTGDEAASISLLIPSHAFSPEIAGSDDISILIFSDRDYNGGVEFESFVTKMLEDSKRIENKSDEHIYFMYESNVGDNHLVFYSTFDPELEVNIDQNQEYIASMLIAEPISLDEFEFVPRPSCTIHYVFDGMLVQISAIGAVCSSSEFGAMVKSTDALFSSWRKKLE